MHRETFERLKREEMGANNGAVGRMMAALGVRFWWP